MQEEWNEDTAPKKIALVKLEFMQAQEEEIPEIRNR